MEFGKNGWMDMGICDWEEGLRFAAVIAWCVICGCDGIVCVSTYMMTICFCRWDPFLMPLVHRTTDHLLILISPRSYIFWTHRDQACKRISERKKLWNNIWCLTSIMSKASHLQTFSKCPKNTKRRVSFKAPLPQMFILLFWNMWTKAKTKI